MWAMEVRERDYGFSSAQQDEIWRRWRDGESFNAMGRVPARRCTTSAVFSRGAAACAKPPRRRSTRHLTAAEREEISRGIAAGVSARLPAKRLGGASSTISRGIAGNGGREDCRAGPADAQTYARARRPEMARRPSGRGVLRDMVPLSARPAEADDRTLPGHWEGDLVMGTHPSAIATLVERTSRYTRPIALPEGTQAEQVRPYLTGSVLAVPQRLRRSLTWDRGRGALSRSRASTERFFDTRGGHRAHRHRNGGRRQLRPCRLADATDRSVVGQAPTRRGRACRAS